MKIKFKQYLQAGYPALYVHTLEPDRAEKELAAEAKEVDCRCYSWDLIRGVRPLNGAELNEQVPHNAVSTLEWLARGNENKVLFAWNFHQSLAVMNVIQAIQNNLDNWKSGGKTLVSLSSRLQIPLELDRTFTVLDFDLPDRERLSSILSDVAESARLPMPNDTGALLDAASGLTNFEAENAFALSAIHPQPFSWEVVSSQKAQMVKKNACIEIFYGKEGFDTIGGLENLKAFSLKIGLSPLARGILLLGLQGCGKSHFAKALGAQLGIPTLALDFGKVFTSLVGESEERMRRALAVADAMAPCVLFIDELDKGLAGADGAVLDGGVSKHLLGTFLTWLNDRTSRVFVIATSNKIDQFPPELLRAERWDAIFFVDLPTPTEREAILRIYTEQYGITDAEIPELHAWSGAEIKSLCRIASITKSSLKEAMKYIIPLSKSMGEKLATIREWARNRTIPASLAAGEGEKSQRRLRGGVSGGSQN